MVAIAFDHFRRNQFTGFSDWPVRIGADQLMGNSNNVSNFLFASLIWGSIGIGFAIYGKKQGAMVPLVDGIALVAVSYIVGSALLMSVISIAIIAAIYFLRKLG